MHLVLVLSTIAVAVLALVSGLAVLAGSRRNQKRFAFSFCLTAAVITVFSVAVAVFLSTGSVEVRKVSLYTLYFSMVVLILEWLVLVGLLGLRLVKTRSKRERRKMIFIGVDLFAMGVGLLAFGLILPWSKGEEWLAGAPLTLGVGLVGLYYAVLRFRIIKLSARWLRFLSYVILMAGASIVYMFIFYLVFTYIFKVTELPGMVFVLNYVMITVVMCLFPVVNEIGGGVSSLIRRGQVDLTFIVKRLNKMAPEDVDLNELADFLADHLHFNYIGFIVGGKLYGSKPVMATEAELRPLMELGDPEYGIWQELDGVAKILADNLEVKAVAELRDGKGRSFGQILVGRPLGKLGFERRDLIQIETIVNLVAAMIDTRARRR